MFSGLYRSSAPYTRIESTRFCMIKSLRVVQWGCLSVTSQEVKAWAVAVAVEVSVAGFSWGLPAVELPVNAMGLAWCAFSGGSGKVGKLLAEPRPSAPWASKFCMKRNRGGSHSVNQQRAP